MVGAGERLLLLAAVDIAVAVVAAAAAAVFAALAAVPALHEVRCQDYH